MGPLLVIIAFVVTTFVIPILRSQSEKRRHFEWIGPWLKEAWACLFVLLVCYLLFFSSTGQETAMRLHPYWKTHPWLGYLLFSILGATIFCGYWMFVGVFTSSDTASADSFSFDVESAFVSVGPDPGFYLLHMTKGKSTISPIYILMFVRLRNSQQIESLIDSYQVEYEAPEGQWGKLIRMDATTGVPYLTSPAKGFKRAQRIDTRNFLDVELSERAMQPFQTIRGWVALSFKYGGPQNIPVSRFRLTVRDTAGKSFSAIKQISPPVDQDSLLKAGLHLQGFEDIGQPDLQFYPW